MSGSKQLLIEIYFDLNNMKRQFNNMLESEILFFPPIPIFQPMRGNHCETVYIRLGHPRIG